MAPKETAGKTFFIPSIANFQWVNPPKMYIIATEDNTPVTVKGDYDQLDLIVHKGDAINRDLVVETAQVHHCEGK